MSLVFLALISNDTVLMSLLAVGLTVAVLTDVFAIRGLPMPTAMTLVGETAGRPVRLFGQRHGAPDPAERYKIDPQFVLRALERVT